MKVGLLLCQSGHRRDENKVLMCVLVQSIFLLDSCSIYVSQKAALKPLTECLPKPFIKLGHCQKSANVWGHNCQLEYVVVCFVFYKSDEDSKIAKPVNEEFNKILNLIALKFMFLAGLTLIIKNVFTMYNQ